MGVAAATDAEREIRFWSRVDRSAGPDACWPWQGALMNGYGFWWSAKGKDRPHRAAYEYAVGPIPGGLVIDHLCRNPACVNPAHLEPVTIGENSHRGVRWTRPKPTCIRGHPNIPENKRGNGGCRLCKNEQTAAEYRRLRATPEGRRAPAAKEPILVRRTSAPPPVAGALGRVRV